MKRPINYKPKFSLSVKYLQRIMTKKEYDVLLKKYVEEKRKNWEGYKGRGKNA